MTQTGRIPVLRVQGTLLVSMQEGFVDADLRALRRDVAESLRGAVAGLVVDLSGVDTMDSFLTRSVRDLAVAAQLMGVETIVCGIRPDVATTIVDMGMELERVRTALGMDHALAMLANARAGRG